MKRDHRSARIATLAGLAALVAALAPGAAVASEGGLVLLPDPGLLGVLVVIFAALIVPVNALILKPIFRVLDERTEKIDGTRQRAERIAAEAEEVLGRYQQAIQEARVEAEGGRKQTLEEARRTGSTSTASARAEAETRVGRAREEMAASLAEARSLLRTQSEDLAREVASRALGRSLS